MKPVRWREIERICNSALDLPSSEREAFVEKACAGDDALRNEVDRLLARRQDAEHFMAVPALDLAAQELAREKAKGPGSDALPKNLLHYRIIEKIGEGGMGEVYRARDERLKRDVAIKVLPAIFTADPERVARFDREARLLASVNHPNVAAIYGVEQADARRFLVMELAEGETLAQRLTKGPLPLAESLEVCRQIAEGVEAAHEKGIIHRDLKPANLKITPTGTVKVLDFGLAKAFQQEMEAPDPSDSPTVTAHMTHPGMILGTAAYMSPEQARGQAVDKRADIWAFGCILYECLTGKRAFEGESATEALASILKGEPDWQLLPATTPGTIKALLQRCLKKDPKQRLRDIGDARFEMEESVRGPAPKTLKRRDWRLVAGVAIGCVGLAIAAASWMTRYLTPSATKPVIRTEIGIGPARQLVDGNRPIRTALALTPDGKSLVFAGSGEKGNQLFLRRLDKWEAVPIAGTEGGMDPFLSPNGQWVGFWAAKQLKKVSIDGGTPVTICNAAGRSYGASWGTNGIIVFANVYGLLMVPEAGGKAEVLTKPDHSKGEFRHVLPQVLPQGEEVLFTTSFSEFDNPRVEVIDLKSRTRKIVLEDGADARYADSGHILFVRQGILCAAAFDISRLAVTGAPVQLIPDIMQETRTPTIFAGQFAYSNLGTLAYIKGGPSPYADRWLVWIDTKGAAQPVLSSTSSYENPRISPDGNRVVYGSLSKRQDIFVADIARGVSMSLTSTDMNFCPFWTPDGSQVTFGRQEKSFTYRILKMSADRSREAETLVESDGPMFPGSWSPSGDELAYVRYDAVTHGDIWIYRTRDKKSEPFINTRSDETYPDISPDGRWLAYASDESGQAEVYVQSFPDRSRKIPISSGGGNSPCWRRDGRQLYFLSNDNKLMVVDVTAGPTFGPARVLMDYYGFDFHEIGIRNYDVHPDGLRFLVGADVIGGKPLPNSEIPAPFLQAFTTLDPKSLTGLERLLRSDLQRKLSPDLERRFRELSSIQIDIIQNWSEELKRLVPTGKN